MSVWNKDEIDDMLGDVLCENFSELLEKHDRECEKLSADKEGPSRGTRPHGDRVLEMVQTLASCKPLTTPECASY